MSTQHKFFDEQVETILLSEQKVVTRPRNLVEFETELHLTNLKNNVGGTFRVVWVNTQAPDGFHSLGLELLEPEGDLWETDLPPPPAEAETTPEAWLECHRCHQRLLTPVPEAAAPFVCEGFVVARHCERCKATTAWGFTTQGEPEVASPKPAEPIPQPREPAPAVPERKPGEDLRNKGRAPINMLVKVTRQKWGTTLEDICQTENVSRTGVYFLTSQNYDIGEQVKIVMPYKEGDVSIPVPARVVRQDSAKGSFQRGVALHLGEKKS
jgi:hypothetical protein